MAEKSIHDVNRFVQMVATKQAWVASPDEAFRDDLCQGLLTNWNRYGYFLCPCRDTEGSREADKDVLCPCTYAADDIANHGHCFCSLYWSKDFAASGKEPQGIPDRRASAAYNA